MFHEVMKGSTSLEHLTAFDMVWRGRAAFCPRPLAGISIHYATCVNNPWVCCPEIVHLVGCLP